MRCDHPIYAMPHKYVVKFSHEKAHSETCDGEGDQGVVGDGGGGEKGCGEVGQTNYNGGHCQEGAKKGLISDKSPWALRLR